MIIAAFNQIEGKSMRMAVSQGILYPEENDTSLKGEGWTFASNSSSYQYSLGWRDISTRWRSNKKWDWAIWGD